MHKRAFEISTMHHVCIDIDWRGEMAFIHVTVIVIILS